MKKISIFIVLISLLTNVIAQTELKSPDQNLLLKLDKVEKSISFSVWLNEDKMISVSDIDLQFDGKSVFESNKFKTLFNQVSETVKPEVALKSKEIINEYNQLTLNFNNNLRIEFRAFNDGVAYRFITAKDKDVEVNESVKFNFEKQTKLWASLTNTFQTSYEANYSVLNSSDFPDSIKTYLPLLSENKSGKKVLITEADVFDYPHMFLKKTESANELSAVFPKYPLDVEYSRDRVSDIKKEANYIAKTNADRTFPWRLLVISGKDADLIKTNLVYLLSRKNQLEDISWIKPGRVSWDWWNASNLYDVDFESGLNTESYKYFIDFASAYGLEYIILDGGWAIDKLDITQANPDIDLPELIRYGNSKNVRLILWSGWLTLHKNMKVMELYKEWGIAGIKVDFMNRSDQWMVNYYEEVAREAAKNELLINFHGSFKPAGLRRAYPNVVTYEAVRGLEYNKWSETVTPTHDVTIPFIRMVCGPMDYTPGAMRNFQPGNFNSVRERPGSMGTRCHQVAQFIIYESGIQMFSDSPSNYYREKETTEFLAEIPVEWDEIKVLEAKVGEFLIIAKRKGVKWFVAGMTNETERTFTVDLSFLESKEYKATIMQDGINAHRFAEDYQRLEKVVSTDTKLEVKMAPGGGFALIIQ
jgi:alpha-glucosidase